jgi:hypothetical protein
MGCGPSHGQPVALQLAASWPRYMYLLTTFPAISNDPTIRGMAPPGYMYYATTAP